MITTCPNDGAQMRRGSVMSRGAMVDGHICTQCEAEWTAESWDKLQTPAPAQLVPTSARWCPLCGAQHAVAKGASSPWPTITRPQIEALPALLAALNDLTLETEALIKLPADVAILRRWEYLIAAITSARAAIALAGGAK